MSIDFDRAKRFAKDIEVLYNKLGFVDFYETFKAKLFNYIRTNQLTGESVEQLFRQIKPLFHDQFRPYYSNIYTDYNAIIQAVNSYYTDLGPDIHRDLEKIKAIEKINNTRLGKYEDATVREIAREVRKGLMAKKHHTEIAKEIEKIDPKAKFYGKTLGQTLVKGYSRESKTEKARIGEIFWFQYVGIIRPATRPFCYACVNKHFNTTEIRQSLNGHNIPVPTYCGGWNCHHDFEPDPFYTDEQGDRRGFQVIEKMEGGRTVRFFGTDEMESRYNEQKSKLASKK